MLSMRFVDLGFVGSRFTWSNRRPGRANICERIDRSIANLSWRVTFPDARIQHHCIAYSDHRPILLTLFDQLERVVKEFKFQSFWIRDQTVLGWWRKLGVEISIVIHLGLCFKRSMRQERRC